MCNPAVAIGAVMAAGMMAQTFQGMNAQKNLAQKQSKLEAESARMQEQAATAARELDLKTLEAKEAQTKQAAEVEKFDRVRQSAKEAAALRLASSEAGVMGSSIFRMLASTQIQEAHDLGIINTNTANAVEQVDRQREEVGATYQGRMNQATLTKKQSKITKSTAPGMGSILIGTTMSGLSGFGSGYSAGSSLSSTPKGAGTPYIPAK